MGNDKAFMDVSVLGKVNAAVVVAGDNQLKVKPFWMCEQISLVFPTGLVHNVYGLTIASDPVPFSKRSAIGVKNVPIADWSIVLRCWASEVFFARFTSCFCTSLRSLAGRLRLRMSFRVNGGFMITRSQRPIKSGASSL